VRDRARLRRVRDDDPPDVAFPQDSRDRHHAAAGVQDDLILAAEIQRELPDRLRCARDPPDLRDLAALSDRDLAELQVNINTEKPHFPRKTALSAPFTSHLTLKLEGAVGSDKYGFGLSAQPGESQGRPYSH
jgi:hypothetical protein